MNLASNDPYQASDFLIEQPDGTFRVGGCLPRKWTPEASPFKPWGSTNAVPMVAKAEWIDGESLRGYQRRTMDQNGYPACCLASLANAMELAAVRDGRPPIALDWLKAWRKLSGGRGGVALDDAAAFAMATGFPLADNSGSIKIAEAWDCPSVEALASSLCGRGAICTFGHSQHAECATRLVKKNGVWGIDVLNSWGQWGEQGPNGWGWHWLALSEVEMGYSIIAVRELAYYGETA